MTTTIALAAHDRKTGRATVSAARGENDSNLLLLVDERVRLGTFIDTPYGALYRHTDGQWGLPDLGYGPHTFAVSYETRSAAASPPAQAFVLNPPSTLGTDRIPVAHPEQLLPHLWDAGFRTERDLLYGLAIAVGEGGLYLKARNWVPDIGFRAPGTVLGVEGPAAAWNADHTQQGHSDRGVYQINSKAWPAIPDADCDDPAKASKRVYEMSRAGTNWSPWGFGEGGEHYSQYFDAPAHGYPALRPLVKAFLASKGA